MNKAAKKYFERYAEPELRLASSLDGYWDNVLVIPVYKEPTSCLESKLNAVSTGNALLILVANRPEDDDNIEWARDWLKLPSRCTWRNEHLSLYGNILIVDRAIVGKPIPKKQGVGLARKIGADIATALIFEKKVRSEWIFSTDADTSLPEDYFTPQDDLPIHSTALTFPFSHRLPSRSVEPSWPHTLYEWHLRYVHAGMQHAKSKHAYFSIGSALAFKAMAYTQVRGFPKRSAGEDFYLLNKLAKIGSIYQASSPTLIIDARFSERVPFGTGPATAKIFAQGRDAFTSYHPKVFEHLGEVIAYLENNTPLSQISAEAANAIGLCNLIAENKQLKLRQLLEWFDAFRQLKLIHWLRDHHFANLPINTIQTTATFELPAIP